MKCVVHYGPPSDMGRAAEHFPAHQVWYEEFHRRGELLMIGRLSEGAMGIFISREAAEKFVDGDPFVRNGVVTDWTLSDWNEILCP